MGKPFAGKGNVKGWDTGKGKGAKEKGGGQGHLKPRTRITAEKFAGEVTGWKGKYGWITPAEAIEHEKAEKHNGSLFVGIGDLADGATSLNIGDQVAYHIFEDDEGLGAEEVEVTAAGAGGGKAGKAKGADKGKSWGKAAATSSWGKAAAFSTPKGGKSWGKAAPAAAPFAAKGFAAGKGKENGKGKQKTPGHMLERNRISAEKFTGEVTKWTGKFGFIKPAEPIEHEKASKHQGCLFTGISDIEGETKELTVGSLCEFHIYEDKTGLGAEEVIQY